MPLQEVIAKYGAGGNYQNFMEMLKKSAAGQTSSLWENLCSIRAEGSSKDKATPGCSSTSTSDWNTNETDVSSSSQQCESSSSSSSKAAAVAECVGSSEDEQVLDSTTTSNGDVEKSCAESSNAPNSEENEEKAEEAVEGKNVDMPDSSGDVDNDCTSSPAKAGGNDECPPLRAKESAKTNGKDVAAVADNVSSSSGEWKVTPALENGEQPSTAGSVGKRKAHINYFYNKLLYNNENADEEDDDDDDCDDDDDYKGEAGDRVKQLDSRFVFCFVFLLR